MLFASQASGGGGLLPPGYTQTEYTEFANSYQSTGIKTSNLSRIEVGLLSVDSSAGYMWQSDTGSSNTTNTTAYYTSNGGSWRFGNKVLTIRGDAFTGGTTFHNVVQKSSGVTIDGVSKGSYSSISAFESTNPLSFGSTTSARRRYSYFRHVKNGVTVSDYRSCKRDSDGQPGMFDLVTRTFLEGTTAGPVLTT